MTQFLTVVPAYGRDYTSINAARADWCAGKDFIINDLFNPYDGKPINRDQAVEAGYTVHIRYNHLRKVGEA